MGGGAWLRFRAEEALRGQFAEHARIGHLVANGARWQAVLDAAGWEGATQRRHGRDVGAAGLSAYGLSEDHLATPAKDCGRPLDEVAAMLEEMAGGRSWIPIPAPEAPYDGPLARE